MSEYYGGGGGGSETTTTMGALINSATAKATPVDADMLPLMDSAASNIVKKLSWANLKATLKTYFFGGSTNGGVLFVASELPVEDDTTFLYDNTDKTLKLLETAYNVATAGWSSASKSALQIGNNNTPHTFGAEPGFYGAKIDIYSNQSSGSFKQTSGIRVRANNAATGGSFITTGVESFVSNAGASANSAAGAMLQALEGVSSVAADMTGTLAGGVGVYAYSTTSSGLTVANLWAVRAIAADSATGTVTNMIGLDAGLISAGGVITNAFGLRIDDWSGSGVVNSYGIYIGSSIDIGTTLKYAFYSLSTSPSLFSGPVSGVINAYDATAWNGSAKFATEDAIRDKIESLSTLIGLLDQAEVLKGTWDASAGTFPGAGAAQAGWKYIVSVGGTVDSITFNVGDRIVAILDNASTSTFAANWFKEDFTDLVSSVNGQVGAVTLLVSEVDADNALPGTNALGELRTTQNGNLWHGSAPNTWDQILKASNFAVRSVTGTTDTILSTDDKKLVTYTNAAAIAATLPQAGSGSPAVFTNGWSVTVKNIGQSVVTFTPTTSTINGAATLILLPGQWAIIWSNGTNYFATVATDRVRTLAANHGTDDTYEGETIVGLNAGATIAQWEPVYLGGSSTWLLADANGSGTYPARGLATAAYSSTNPAVILIRGTVRNDAWAWTPGGTIYLSGTAGALTQTAPSTSGDKVQEVGYALTADIAFFDFNSTYLTVT